MVLVGIVGTDIAVDTAAGTAAGADIEGLMVE